jgi:hypothetical protein
MIPTKRSSQRDARLLLSERFGSRDKVTAQVANLVHPLREEQRDRSEDCSAFDQSEKKDLIMH